MSGSGGVILFNVRERVFDGSEVLNVSTCSRNKRQTRYARATGERSCGSNGTSFGLIVVVAFSLDQSCRSRKGEAFGKVRTAENLEPAGPCDV